MYALAGGALKAERSVWGGLSRDSPERNLSTSVQKMELLVGFLRRLWELAGEHVGNFQSPAFRRFFAMLEDELDEEYLELVASELESTEVQGGTLLSAQLGAGNKGKAYMLRRPASSACSSAYSTGRATASRSPTAMTTGSGPSASSRTGASTRSPTRWPSRSNTS